LDYTFIIFDRTGKEVFKTNDIAVGWNGDNKNNDDFYSSTSIYNYRIQYDNPFRLSDEPIEVMGSVLLIR